MVWGTNMGMDVDIGEVNRTLDVALVVNTYRIPQRAARRLFKFTLYDPQETWQDAPLVKIGGRWYWAWFIGLEYLNSVA